MADTFTGFSMQVLSLIFAILASVTQAQNFEVTFPLVEESERWTFIGNVSTAPGFMEYIPVEDRNHLLFSFLQQTSIKSMISVHDETGSLYTTVVVDRESLVECRAPPPCVLTFDIAARSIRKDSSLFEIISVNVIVKDINDNAPIFPLTTQLIEIPESAINGSSYLVKSAEDTDTGTNNSIQYYELDGYNELFTLDVERKLDGSLSVKLLVIGRLDREIKDFYTCNITAWDGGNPAKSGTMKLNISIKDENDNAPELTKTAYNITIKENTEPGTGILQIEAIDQDIGDNGKIEYRFSPHQQDTTAITSIFAMNEVTGVLSVIGDLVYEPGKNYKIIVEAIDKGSPPLLSQKQAIVTINIEDSGNNPPSVKVNLLSTGSGRVKNVSEGAGPGSFVAHVEVDDKDTGQNGVVTCSVSGDLFELDSLPNKGYKVVVKGELDREKQDIHTVTVTCRDNGVPSLTNSSTFLVRVTDENDNAPIFSTENYVEEIYENNKIGAIVITVVATDEDSGHYGDIFYYLDPLVTPYFRIDPNKGIIKAMISFDRENKTSWTFKVFAADLGKPSQNGSATVLINILDVNDNAPKFNVSVFNFSVMENCPSGKYVDRLIAYDPDTEENGIFTFAISDTAENDLPFFLFPDGVIKTNRELDREIKRKYEFTVIAIDKGVPKRTSSVKVVVNVDDENDEPPFIEFPNPSNNTVILPHLLPVGTFITRIRAYDADIGGNKQLSYFISSGNTGKLFHLNARTGIMTMANRIEVKEGEEEQFQLTIEVHDGGIPQHSVHETLHLIVQYSNATLAAEPLEGSGLNSHIAIVIVVIVITVFLSAAIIVVICLIRKFDRDRLKSQDIQISKLHNNLSDTKETNQNGTLMSRPYDKVDSLKKKKEVSFSFEDDLDGFREHEISFGNNSVFGDVDHEVSVVISLS